MNAPAGPCEWCGGPQIWTIASGIMYVKCKGGCVSLFAEERVNFPPDSEGAEQTPKVGVMEHSAGMGVLPLEGGAAKETDSQLEGPPGGWLLDLWEGFDAER